MHLGDRHMNEKIIKSGEEVVKEFVQNLQKDTSLDRDVAEAISVLYIQKKLTSTRLQQILDSKRK